MNIPTATRQFVHNARQFAAAQSGLRSRFFGEGFSPSLAAPPAD
jgi:hypothetical protein